MEQGRRRLGPGICRYSLGSASCAKYLFPKVDPLKLIRCDPDFIAGRFVYENSAREAFLSQPHHSSIGRRSVNEPVSYNDTITEDFDRCPLEPCPIVVRIGSERADMRQICHDRPPAEPCPTVSPMTSAFVDGFGLAVSCSTRSRP